MEHDKSSQGASDQDDSTAGYSLGGVRLPSPSEAVSGLKAGTEIDDFEILDPIGSGGWGVVYRANQKSVSRKVAFKVIHCDKSAQLIIERFILEKKALGSLNHPNVVSVIAGGSFNGQPYFAMELVDGLTITKYADKKRLPIPQRLELFLQVCDAVGHAHELGIIHRDLKPANILVKETEHGEPLAKVIDFGIAKVLLSELAPHTGQPIGTPAYMSPEQADPEIGNIKKTTDIYALGVVLYELLAGVLPYKDEETARIIGAGSATLRTPIPMSVKFSRLPESSRQELAIKRVVRPNTLAKQLQGEIGKIVMKCLTIQETGRYQSAQQLTHDLQTHLKRKHFGLVFSIIALPVCVVFALWTAHHYIGSGKGGRNASASTNPAQVGSTGISPEELSRAAQVSDDIIVQTFKQVDEQQ